MSSPNNLGSINDVTKRLGVKSPNTIYNKMRRENFPRPITIGTRTKRWICSEVDEWIASKIALRNRLSE
jgi:predicted DNA-binding transcriptional regulator AlpA